MILWIGYANLRVKQSHLLELPHLAEVVVILILHDSHILCVDPSLDLHDHLAGSALDLVVALFVCGWMQEPLLVQIAIVVVHYQSLVHLAALAGHVDVLAGVRN